MRHNLYIYRNYIIVRTSTINKDNKKGWTILDESTQHSTLDNAKNSIDKILGGWSGKCEPQRHFKKNSLGSEKNDYYN